VNSTPSLPPGDEAELREAQAQAELAAQRQRVDRIMASKREMLHSPLGLRALFPTNKITVKIKHKVRDARPRMAPAPQLEEPAQAPEDQYLSSSIAKSF
jgi:hypothetical protein